MLSSPLTEYTAGDPLPDLISGSRYILHEGAMLTAEDPLAADISLPQWAYAIQFPLNHAVIASRSPDKPYVVQLELLVAPGTVGVAGCNASRSAFTTPEIFASGQSLVRLTVDNPRETEAIVIRKASPDPDVIRVVIDNIAVFEPEKERLVPRRHDLDYDLFIILSAAKTGTQTIESTLNAISPFLRVHRVHYASAQGTTRLRTLASAAAEVIGNEHEAVRSLNLQADAGDLARTEIDTVRRLGGRIAFLTAVREPVGRAVAELFQLLPILIPVYPWLLDAGHQFIDLLGARLLTAWDQELRATVPPSGAELLWSRCLATVDYLDDEFCTVSGIDVLSRPFNQDEGFFFLEQGGDAAFAFRTADLNYTLPTALGHITDQSITAPVNRNVASDKIYATLYDEFLRRFQVPADLVNKIYLRHGYMRHFIREADITASTARWSAPPAAATGYPNSIGGPGSNARNSSGSRGAVGISIVRRLLPSPFSIIRPQPLYVPKGYIASWGGTLIRKEFAFPERSLSVPDDYVFTAPRRPDASGHLFEWHSLAAAIRGARDSFCMVELGAGYGRWSVAAGVACARLDLRCDLIAVEAEPSHFSMMKQHFEDNGLDWRKHTLIEAAVAAQGGSSLYGRRGERMVGTGHAAVCRPRLRVH